jgi:hypothetical protein
MKYSRLRLHTKLASITQPLQPWRSRTEFLKFSTGILSTITTLIGKHKAKQDIGRLSLQAFEVLKRDV